MSEVMNDAYSSPIWYPFTQMKLADPPIAIRAAKDATLYAEDGREFIDAIASWWVNLHGHAHPAIAEAISKQAKEMEHVIFAGFTHRPALQFAEELLKILPEKFHKIFFSDDGSTAVEVGLKMAIQYWNNQGISNKTKIIAFQNGYHGDTFGSMSVGSRSEFNLAFTKFLFDAEYIDVPDDNNVNEVLHKFENILSAGDVAAFLFEPLVQGAGGMLMHSPKHLDQLMALAVKHQVLTIADEVMTGFGRTGRNFACEYLEHKPDIICLSKGNTGGFMPLGVTASTEKIFSAFYSDDRSKTLYHGHSYTANPLACAAALASLEILQSEKCQRQIRNISERHRDFVKQFSGTSGIRDIRTTGTILAIELNTGDDTSYFSSIRNPVYRYALDRGVLLRPLGNVIYTMPPYCITSKELEKVYEVMAAIVEKFGWKEEASPRDHKS